LLKPDPVVFRSGFGDDRLQETSAMTAKSSFSKWLWAVGLGVILAAVLALSGTSTASAGSLPPRPTPAPTSIPGGTTVVGTNGAYIELHVPAAQSGWWIMVQWQDGQKNWHDVTTWQGTLDEVESGVGLKTWWVAPADLGKGPFRWVVSDAKGGQVVAVSEAFNLPATQRVKVVVSAAPK
jgi:hypothetical protein